MRASAKAGIDFFGTAMRYSEVEQFGAQYRLLRLGDCDFEFDVSEVLFGDGPEEHLEVVSDAIAEIFHGTTATHFRFVVHPPSARIFSSVEFAGSTAWVGNETVALESALLFEHQGVESMHQVAAERQPSEGSIVLAHPVLVSSIPSRVHARFEKVMANVQNVTFDCASSSAVLLSLTKAISKKSNTDGFQLSIGSFEEYTEFNVTDGERWITSQVRDETDPGDVSYFALHILNGLEKNDRTSVGVRLYGTHINQELRLALLSVFGGRVSPLNPISVVDLESDQFDDDFQFESFVLCLGAAL